MRATKGDPEDVTGERLDFIVEKVTIVAGEFAAAKVRAENEEQFAKERLEHEKELERLRSEVASKTADANARAQEALTARLRHEQDQQEFAMQAAHDARVGVLLSGGWVHGRAPK